MSFTFAAAASIVAAQGKGVTYGKNKYGGVVQIVSGHWTLEEMRALDDRVESVEYSK